TEIADEPASAPLEAAPVRVVAFYDPSAHRHWLDVASAGPRFIGHAQPRLPKLAFYDARGGAVFDEQVHLARNHRVEAFCVRVAWGDEHEAFRPVLAHWRETEALPFSCCLCFDLAEGEAGETADAQEFIAYAAAFLRDPRYMRVGVRPVLVLARPQRIPDC